jgi:hypothetical protein
MTQVLRAIWMIFGVVMLAVFASMFVWVSVQCFLSSWDEFQFIRDTWRENLTTDYVVTYGGNLLAGVAGGLCFGLLGIFLAKSLIMGAVRNMIRDGLR